MSRESPEIRELAPADLPAIARINTANVPAVGAETDAAMAHLLGQCCIALGVDVEGELAGFCYVLAPGADYGSMNYEWFAEHYDSFVYLDRVAFAAPFRGRGYGAALYREVERRATGSADWFTLEVNLVPRNDGSLRFHARAGFREVGRQQTGPGKLVSLMAKPLPPNGLP